MNGNHHGLRPSHRLGNPLPERIAVFRALQFGDLLCAVPALRALRTALPRARITLIGLPWARGFVDRFRHYLDEFVEFPGYPGLAERAPDLAQIPDFLSRLRGRAFDLMLQLHGSGVITNPLAALLGARRMAGFTALGAYTPDPERFMPWPSTGTEADRLLALMEFLGIPAQGDHLEFPIFPADEAALGPILGPAVAATGEWVCIHPGARWSSRRWRPEGFAAVADGLAADGYRVLITGTADERPLAERVAASMRSRAFILTGRTSLGALGALLSRARLLVCNDTGVSHVAAALGTPSVVLSLGSDAARWAPKDRGRHRLVQTAVECRPCDFQDCPIGHPCSTGISPDQVLAEARAQLGCPMAAATS